jgi:DNA invertase Pin-like site-specific DNA recombinase
VKAQSVAYGYARVTTGGQVEKGHSLEVQQKKHLEYHERKLAAHGVLWGGTFVDDETVLKRGGKKKGVSAGTKFASRKAGAALLGRLKPGDHVILTSLDRAFRNFKDGIVTTEEWMEKGIHIHLIRHEVDTSTPMGKWMLRSMAMYAEMEREWARERTREVLRSRKREGKAVNGFPGYGRRMEGQKGHRRVVDDAREREVMAQIVDLHDNQKKTFDQIYLVFLQANIRTRRNEPWSKARLYRAYKAELALRSPSPSATSSSGPTRGASGSPSTASPTALTGGAPS